jgi:hypothetical protein
MTGRSHRENGLRAALGKRRYRAAAYVAFLCGCALLLEGSLRLFPRGKRPSTYDEAFTNMPADVPLERSDYLPFTLASAEEVAASPISFAYATNSLGFRGAAPAQARKSDGVRRILLLGDSFTFGWAQPDDSLTFPAILASKVAQVDPRWEVINAGYHAGYSPDAYHAFLAGSEGAELDADVVVLNIFTNNDVTDMVDTIWAETDAHGAPTRVFTRCGWADYRGELLSEYSVPWYYRVPLLRNSVTAIWLGQMLSDSGASPGAGIDTSARFVAAIEGLARLAEAGGFELYAVAFDVPNVRPPPKGTKRLVETTLEDRLGEENVRILHGFYGTKHEIAGDGHWNELGARAHANQVFALIEPALGSRD